MARARRAGGGGAPPPEAEQQPPGDPEAVARLVCLRLLNQRARSREELAAALRKRGVPVEPANRVLDRFADVGLIDDPALAQALAGAQHRERGLARRAVAAKLRQRGFEGEVVDEALSTIDADDERKRARQLVERRLRSLAGVPVETKARRLVGLLARKGYPAGLAWETVRGALADDVATGETATATCEQDLDSTLGGGDGGVLDEPVT